MQDFDIAIHLEPTWGLAYHYRSEMFFKLSDYEGSLNDVNKAIELANAYIPNYELRGDILALTDPLAARKDYIFCLRFDKKNAKRYKEKLENLKTIEGRKKIVMGRFL